ESLRTLYVRFREVPPQLSATLTESVELSTVDTRPTLTFEMCLFWSAASIAVTASLVKNCDEALSSARKVALLIIPLAPPRPIAEKQSLTARCGLQALD